MINDQMDELRRIEQMLKEGKITPIQAHARRNAVGAGMNVYREQYPDTPASKSTLGKMKMPAPQKAEEE